MSLCTLKSFLQEQSTGTLALAGADYIEYISQWMPDKAIGPQKKLIAELIRQGFTLPSDDKVDNENFRLKKDSIVVRFPRSSWRSVEMYSVVVSYSGLTSMNMPTEKDITASKAIKLDFSKIQKAGDDLIEATSNFYSAFSV